MVNIVNRKGYRINAKQDREVEILIYEEIGAGWLGGISAKQFAEDLKGLKNVERINLRINSEGGSVFDGHAIYNLLRNHDAHIIVDIDGLAASIASVIAMSGDEIRMAENGFMMIHDPWMVAAGTAAELREQAELMDKVQEKLVNTYAKRTGADEKDISGWMAEETWMTAEEALERGFIDSITEEQRMAACVHHVDRYKHVPQALMEPETPRLDNVKRDVNSYLIGSLKKLKL